jgi:hypothetical protein
MQKWAFSERRINNLQRVNRRKTGFSDTLLDVADSKKMNESAQFLALEPIPLRAQFVATS